MPRDRFEELVTESVKLVHAMSRCQFTGGDIALEIAPLRTHDGDMTLSEDELGVEGALRQFAEVIGLSFHTVRTYRWVAARWPAEQRQEGVSFEVHRILASAPDAFEQIKDPPLNERTGRRQWSGDAAKRAAGWATATPVTVQEKVESIRDLAADETVAVQAACELLQRPEVAFRAMRDRQARSGSTRPSSTRTSSSRRARRTGGTSPIPARRRPRRTGRGPLIRPGSCAASTGRWSSPT